MRTCSQCDEEKVLEDFYFNKSKNQYDYWCKDCQREYRRGHYRKNKQYYVDKASKYSTENYFDVNTAKIRELFESSGCTDCDITDWRVLEFDHVPGQDKLGNISTMARNYPWVKVQAEIDKCEIVCKNCHALRTYERSGSWRMTIAS